MADERLFATFRVDGDHFAVDALDVQEVLQHQPMTRVPLAPPDVRGLINLRGQVVVALDLRRRLGRPPCDDRETTSVVVRTEHGPVSFLVDEIGDVLEVDTERLEAPPETVAASGRDLLVGIHTLPDGLLLVLDVERTAALDAARAEA